MFISYVSFLCIIECANTLYWHVNNGDGSGMYHGDLSNGIRTQRYHWDLYGLFFLNVPHEGLVWICMGLVWLLFGWVKSLPV